MTYETEPLKDEFTIPALNVFQYETELNKMRENLQGLMPWEEETILREEELKEWRDDREYGLSELFDDHIKQLEENGEYYYGCSFELYEATFEKRKNTFFEEFKDAYLIDFIEEELKKGISEIPYNYLFPKTRKRMLFSLNKRFEILYGAAFLRVTKVLIIPQIPT